MYAINREGGYIVSIVAGVSATNSNATESEYMAVKAMLENAPTAPDGYGYRLTDTLEWELYELPVVEEVDGEATETDYQAALRKMGVNL